MQVQNYIYFYPFWIPIDMNKFLLFILFTSFTFFAKAQEARSLDNNPLSEITVKAIKFYPNPASTVINFELIKANQKDLTLQVYNFIGKKIYELSISNQKTTISLADFYRGVYIFQLRDKAGRILESGKFQVVK